MRVPIVLKPFRRAAAAAAILVLATACSVDNSTSPAQSVDDGLGMRRGDILASPTDVKGAQWKSPLASDITVSAIIGPRGGTLSIPQTGFTLTVPKNAVTQNTQFSVTANAGSVVAYSFEPHGTAFPVPLVASQDTRMVDLSSIPVLANVQIGYFPDPTSIDQTQDKATVSEFAASLLDLVGNRVRFNIWHFSGYMVSSGRWGGGDQ